MSDSEASDAPKKHVPKRVRGEGGLFEIQVRGRTRYRAVTTERVEVESRDGTTKVVKKQISGTGDTKPEALARHRANVAKFHKLAPARQAQDRRSPETLSHYYYETWIKGSRATKWRAHTFAGVRQRLEQHVLPLLGDSPLIYISRDDIRDLVASWTEKGMAEATQVNLWRNLSTLFSDAVYDDRLDANPMDKIRPSERPQKKAPDAFYIPPGLVSRVQHAVRGTDQEPLRMLSLMLGLRIAELLGLTWDVVHLEEPMTMIEIRQQLKPIPIPHGDGCRRVPETGKFGCGRTGANCPHHSIMPTMRGTAIYPYVKTTARNVALVPSLVDLLKQQKARQDEWKKSPEWEPVERQGMDRLVFTTPTGKPLRQQTVGAEWKELLLACGFTELTQHKSRHIAITALILNGTPLSVIGSIVGHADSKVTEKVYAQIHENDQRAHMQKLSLDYSETALELERERIERLVRVTRENVERAMTQRANDDVELVQQAREASVARAYAELEGGGRNGTALGLEEAWRSGFNPDECWRAVLTYAKRSGFTLDFNAVSEAELLRVNAQIRSEMLAR